MRIFGAELRPVRNVGPVPQSRPSHGSSGTPARVAVGLLGVALVTGLLSASGGSSAANAATASSVARTATVTQASALTTTAVTTRIAATSARAAAIRKAQARTRYVSNVRTKIMRIARSRVGMNYAAGGAGPRRFDCSGFALYVWRHAAGRSLPHSSQAQYRALRSVSLSHLKAGDLLFYLKGGVHHVAVYVGHGRMIHAANPRQDVIISSINDRWYRKHFSGARRLF